MRKKVIDWFSNGRNWVRLTPVGTVSLMVILALMTQMCLTPVTARADLEQQDNNAPKNKALDKEGTRKGPDGCKKKPNPDDDDPTSPGSSDSSSPHYS